MARRAGFQLERADRQWMQSRILSIRVVIDTNKCIYPRPHFELTHFTLLPQLIFFSGFAPNKYYDFKTKYS